MTKDLAAICDFIEYEGEAPVRRTLFYIFCCCGSSKKKALVPGLCGHLQYIMKLKYPHKSRGKSICCLYSAKAIETCQSPSKWLLTSILAFLVLQLALRKEIHRNRDFCSFHFSDSFSLQLHNLEESCLFQVYCRNFEY